MKQTALIALCLAAMASQASAGPTCGPSDDNARILASASPSAIHRDWRSKHVGWGWSLQVARSAHDAAGTAYYVGDLYDPLGSLSHRGVFVIENQWDCGP